MGGGLNTSLPLYSALSVINENSDFPVRLVTYFLYLSIRNNLTRSSRNFTSIGCLKSKAHQFLFELRFL